MPSKSFTLDDSLDVTVYKRRGNRHLRLSVAPSGKVRVSIPPWAPYRAGLDFARSRRNWIIEQYDTPDLLRSDQAIGKGHHLQFVAKAGLSRVATRVNGTTITISHPPNIATTGPEAQMAARKACIRSLRAQAQRLLPQRLASLAETHGFEYQSIKIKQLTSRWGSCDQQGQIALSLFLMQLPWDLIDYVLLHELTHTRVLRHGPDFWQAMEAVSPQAKAQRKQLRGHRTVLTPA